MESRKNFSIQQTAIFIAAVFLAGPISMLGAERARSTQAALKFFRSIANATHTSIIEENQKAITPKKQTVALPMAPAGIETLRVNF